LQKESRKTKGQRARKDSTRALGRRLWEKWIRVARAADASVEEQLGGSKVVVLLTAIAQ